MEERIKLTINSLDLITEERDNFYINKIQKGEERNVREWRKHLVKLVKTFNQEQNSSNMDNLLEIAGSDAKPMERISPKVIKLSNISLSSNQINVLKLGLSFTPTLKSNIPE